MRVEVTTTAVVPVKIERRYVEVLNDLTAAYQDLGGPFTVMAMFEWYKGEVAYDTLRDAFMELKKLGFLRLFRDGDRSLYAPLGVKVEGDTTKAKVMAVLEKHADPDRVVRKSQQFLAADCGLHIETYRSAIARLMSEKKVEKAERGDRKMLFYRVL